MTPGGGDANELCVCTVVARFRPQNKVELGSGGQPIVEFENEDTCKISVRFKPDFLGLGVWLLVLMLLDCVAVQ